MAAGIPTGERPPIVRVADEPLFNAVREVPDDLRLVTFDLRRRSSWSARAFTLVELIAVIAIIAIFTGVIGVALRNAGSETVGLQSAQSTLVSLLNLARSEAAVRSRDAAVFVHYDTRMPDRYLRFLVVAWDDGGTWKPVSEGAMLPTGCYVVPYGGPPGTAIEAGADWTGVESTALNFEPPALALLSADNASWRRIVYKPLGTSADPGKLLVCSGIPQLDGTDPVRFLNPDNVRGVSVSTYGQLFLLTSRKDF